MDPTVLALWIALALGPRSPAEATARPQVDGVVETLDIPRGSAPSIDGALGRDEWDDAARLTIRVEPGWTVEARYKHDGAYLYFAFSRLKKGDQERYPEVMVDAGGDGGDAWDANDHWFHASYRDCDAVGRPDAYESCEPRRPGWSANNFPLDGDGVVELRVAFSRIGLVPGRARPLGIALHLTDTRERYSTWPEGASPATPASWATMTAPDRWGTRVATPGVPSGRVDSLRVASIALGDTLTVPVYLPPGHDRARPTPTVYAFMDGVYFAHPAVRLPLAMDSLLAAGLPGAVVVGLPGAAAPNAHHPDTPAGDAWQRFVVDEVVPAVERRYGTTPRREHRHLLGFSSGANVLVDLAVRHPSLFGRVAAQSPGWMDWNDARSAIGRVFLPEAVHNIADAPAGPLPSFWFAWGDGDMVWEVRSRENGARVIDALRGRGAAVEEAPLLAGEHGISLVNQSLGDALRFLLRGHAPGDRTAVRR